MRLRQKHTLSPAIRARTPLRIHNTVGAREGSILEWPAARRGSRSPPLPECVQRVTPLVVTTLKMVGHSTRRQLGVASLDRIDELSVRFQLCLRVIDDLVESFVLRINRMRNKVIKSQENQVVACRNDHTMNIKVLEPCAPIELGPRR